MSTLMLLISGALPNVAGIGPIELSSMMLLSAVLGTAPAASALVLYRIATYYTPFFISIPVFLALQKKLIFSQSLLSSTS